MKNICSVLKVLYTFLLVVAALIICGGSVGFSVFTVIAFGTYFALIAFFIFLTGKKQLSFIIASSLIIILQLLSQLKVHFYKERLFFQDIYVALDYRNLETLLYYPLGMAALFGLFLFLIFNIFIFRKSTPITGKTRVSLLIAAFVVIGLNIYLSSQRTNIETWQNHLPKGRGTISNLFISAHEQSYTPPYFSQSDNYFLEKMKTVSLTSDNNVKKPDIIVLLQESTFNPRLFDFNSQTLPDLTLFSQPNSGLLRVRTFGGGTWISEFAVLTGLDPNDFSFRKNSVFYIVAENIQTSLFKEAVDNGYQTVVLSSMGYGNYNAGPAYTHFGMQTFLQPQDLGYPGEKGANLWHIPTKDLLECAKKVLETYTDKPLLLYVLTMDEHGPYDENTPDQYQLTQLTQQDKAFVGRLNDYLPRIERLNAATNDLTSYIQNRANPTLFFYFGDHQPALNWQGEYKTELATPTWLTQYALTSNYPIDKASYPVLDLSLASGMILEKANLQVSDFYQANIAMRYLCDGKLDDCDDKQLVNSYKHYIYQTLKDAGEEK
ncbi:sulfatase-like hydrolase/transferase [Zophobihabitans entericus]|uniref:Sulfatase-like hydrolase/transferase n=1 Tax=Zophobihabitans entericus TaxID=1635327 RepID=A0A6G9IBD5_9GAMM|nr:sulfatase-like hydrolase/transferase [Zophobihabitans entericus]QIQ21541.1 sulfatase-like hydrolase/transferase [Zophobihabitans entericus]